MQKLAKDANPSLTVSYDAGNEPQYVIQEHSAVNEGTLIVELADPLVKKAVWWGVAENSLTGKSDKDVSMVYKKIQKMFEKYPPPAKK